MTYNVFGGTLSLTQSIQVRGARVRGTCYKVGGANWQRVWRYESHSEV